MKIFIDSADLNEIKNWLDFGFVDGVTTNPSLVKKAGSQDHDATIKSICDLIPGPVLAETLSLDHQGIVEEGRRLAGIADQVVVKIPMCSEGLKAVHTLSQEGIATCVTLIFSSSQAFLAAKAGARYLCPFVGRLDDISHDGMALIEDIVSFLAQSLGEQDCEVLVASIRSPEHVMSSAIMGADIATVPVKVLGQMEKHPLTDKGIEQFLEDAKAFR